MNWTTNKHLLAAQRLLKQSIKDVGVMKSPATIAIVSAKNQNFDTVPPTNFTWTGFPRLCLKRLLKEMAMWHPVRRDESIVLLEGVEYIL
jgi:hypothetical protein